ncbi:hypothetical protein IGI04_029926 [Brassica rapa subsp. trilocularis]|uniref:Thioredoxin domain-containing protein n=1 Tax=Brassica rapa subsp. trilocularis TaxID=1813537 RepID=A0ABQ7LQV0_BRACM|nr:hypothetical protein IGI04_029926 [Brassica rapa subsp. trilocularis]
MSLIHPFFFVGLVSLEAAAATSFSLGSRSILGDIGSNVIADQNDNTVEPNAINFVSVFEDTSAKFAIVIDFTATWCPPCRFIAPVFVDMAKKFLNVVFFKIDADELQSVAKEFKVEAMPTFLFMREGEVVDRVVGARKEEIHQTLMKHGGLASSA